MTRLQTYRNDPFLSQLLEQIKEAGPMRSSLLDITHRCNLRCKGCYFFSEGMDEHRKETDDDAFEAFVEAEVARGTRMLNVVGGEPALEIDRLRLLAKHFHLVVVTNGTMPVPMEGLENIRLAISFWGSEAQDRELRAAGKKDIFAKSLEMFHGDPRAGYYFTTLPGYAEGIRPAAEKMIDHGYFVGFNFYGDLSSMGGRYDHRNGFEEVVRQIDALRNESPEYVVSSPYTNQAITSRWLKGEDWGYEVCPSLTYDHPDNADRMSRKKYPTQFRAYNADLKTTRRCCIGSARDCDTCTDLWATSGWIQGAMRRHVRSQEDFTNWLGSTYIFYLQTRMIDWAPNRHLLPELYDRMTLGPERPSKEPLGSLRLPVVRA